MAGSLTVLAGNNLVVPDEEGCYPLEPGNMQVFGMEDMSDFQVGQHLIHIGSKLGSIRGLCK